jgi:hypothetical protein
MIRNELEMRFSGLALEPLELLGGRGTDASVARAPVGPSHLFSVWARVVLDVGRAQHLSHEDGCRRGAKGDGRYTLADAGSKIPCVLPTHGVCYLCASSR